MSRDEGCTRPETIGLCATCRHLREQASRRGSVFYRCARADEDEGFLRYPPLPVLRCHGYEEAAPARRK
jgi:hypothetical protein